MSRSTVLSSTPGVAGAAAPFPFVYQALRASARAALGRWFDLRVEGLEHLPTHGPYIVAANHHNYLDGVVLGVALPKPIAFLVMPRVWRATPLHPILHRQIGSILLNLERPDVGALRRALRALDDGRVVGIFPEGPFSVRGRLERGLPGVGLLALRAGVPVVPAGIRGTFQALVGRRGYIPRRHPLAVTFGPPRHFSRDAEQGRLARGRTTQRIMDDIAALLP
ncbi:MAG TPA: lysophospholipid acyltransferase family protein [Candidatus Acidoferrum sp.]|jgi:1-acyl-sn-glycerol-3-phosphate acyltransferase|nr:lysophospholipid acyltransferase family protein [Candidatus Acidoferrum sp.]